MTKSISLILLGMVLVSGIKAQDDDYGGDDGAYGYTSVEYDASTNTISVYAETDIGTDGAYYNGVYLNTRFSDATTGQLLAHSNVYNANCQQDNSVGEATNYFACSFTANPGDTYQAVSQHGLSMAVSDAPENNPDYEYYDACGYSTFAQDDLSAPFAEEYIPPYFAEETRRANLPLGTTNDSAVAGDPATCGDVRDTLIQEYISYASVYTPSRPT